MTSQETKLKQIDVHDEIDKIFDRFEKTFSDDRMVDSYCDLLDDLEGWTEKLAVGGPEAVEPVKQEIIEKIQDVRTRRNNSDE